MIRKLGLTANNETYVGVPLTHVYQQRCHTLCGCEQCVRACVFPCVRQRVQSCMCMTLWFHSQFENSGCEQCARQRVQSCMCMTLWFHSQFENSGCDQCVRQRVQSCMCMTLWFHSQFENSGCEQFVRLCVPPIIRTLWLYSRNCLCAATKTDTP
jgi:hypothetical protein